MMLNKQLRLINFYMVFILMSTATLISAHAEDLGYDVMNSPPTPPLKAMQQVT